MPVMINRRFTVLKRLPKPTEGGKSEEALFKFEIEVNGSWLLMKKEMTLGETKMIAVSPYIYLLEISSWDSTQTEYMDTMTQIVGSNLLTDGDFEGYEVLEDGDFSKEGAENVLNGDFNQEGVENILNGDFSEEGAEEITNGDFANGFDDWSNYGIRSVSGGIVTIGASNNSGIYQNALTNGKSYTVTINVTSYDGVGIAQLSNNDGVNLYTITAIGIQTFTFKHNIASGNLIIRGLSNALFSISSVSVKEVGQDWSLSGDWTVSNEAAESVGTASSFLVQSGVVPLSVKNYQLTYEVVTTNNGQLRISGGNSAFGNVTLSSAVGVHTVSLQSNGTRSNLQIWNGTAFIGSIDNISLKEVGQGWNVSATGISIAGAKLTRDATATASIFQSSSVITPSALYEITFEIVDYTSGTLTPRFGWNGTGGTAVSGVGTYTQTIIKVNQNVIELYGSAFIGSIDNVSVKEVGSDWTLGEGWSIGGGSASSTLVSGNSNLTQVALEIGKTYNVTYTVSNYSAGTIHAIVGGWTHESPFNNSNGTFTSVLSNTHASANTTFYLQGREGFTGSIDNISVIKVGADWNEGSGWSVSGGVATHSGSTSANISQNISLTVGDTYSVTYTVVNASSGSRVGIAPAGTDIQIIRTVAGTYTETFTAVNSSFYLRSLWNDTNPVSVDVLVISAVQTVEHNLEHLQATINRTDLFPDFKPFLDSGSGDYPIDY